MKEMELIVIKEARAVDDKEKKPLYSEEEKAKMNELLKTTLTPGKMITVHHIKNAKLIFKWLMIFSRMALTLKKVELIGIKITSTAEVADLHLRKWRYGIIADLGKIQVGKGTTGLISDFLYF